MSLWDRANPLNGADFKQFKEMYSRPVERQQEENKPPNVGEFQKLNDAMKNNPDTALWNWTLTQEDVRKAEDNVKFLFDAYLFEMMKPQFAEYCKSNGFTQIQEYVDVTLQKAKEYISPSDEFAKEREEYKKIISDLTETVKEFKNAKEAEIKL